MALSVFKFKKDVLTQKETIELYKIIRKKWQNLLTRQFNNEGTAIPGKKTGYVPWEERASPRINPNEFFTRRLSIGGKKENVVFHGRPLLQLSYPTLLTRYKRNIKIGSKNGETRIFLEYPKLLSGGGTADARVHQLGAPRKTVSEGVPTTGLPKRELSIESFKLIAREEALLYITTVKKRRVIVDSIKESFRNRPGPFVLKSDNNSKFDIPF